MYIEGAESDYNKGESSHERLISTIKSEIKRNHRLDAYKYYTAIKNLKMNRRDADYKRMLMDRIGSFGCICMASELNKLLIKLFNININPKNYDYD
jgi:hypothetical protein